MFERDLKARSRMVKSSYDYLFAKPSLRWLFEDYMNTGAAAHLANGICIGGKRNITAMHHLHLFMLNTDMYIHVWLLEVDMFTVNIQD